MRGIDASRHWFETAGLPMLEREFAAELPRIAVGLAGRGSECFGFDDEISRDHDYRVGFTLWLTEADERAFGFRLERAYVKLRRDLPPEHETGGESRLGRTEHGVTTIADFYRRHLGFPGAPECWRQWLHTPEYTFAEATNGAVFRDDAGVFSAIRRTILTGMPEDVRRKKLAARAVLMAQSGQYNFARCLRHGEPGAAALALAEFVRNAVSMIFLLNRRFAPYYKWQFRAMRELPELADMADALTALLTAGTADADAAGAIDRICAGIVTALRAQGLSDDPEEVYLEPHAFAIMSGIRDREIRALHVMEG